jgi:hypothetical protein
VQTLSHDAYLALRADATVLERDLHGDKVLQLADGSYLKLFRRKRLISSAAWYPYAQRFADNALIFQARGIPCPVVRCHLPHPRHQARRRAVCAAGGQEPAPDHPWRRRTAPGLRALLGRFVARLHAAASISAHFTWATSSSRRPAQPGLIDIADLRAQATVRSPPT